MKIGIVALSVVALLSFLPSPAHGQGEIGFIEKFALAPDREAVLTELIPGSEDYYFFHALHYQNTRQKEKLKEILEQWKTRRPKSPRREVIENREALLSYDATPQETLAFLRKRLNLHFDHQQAAPGQKPDLPSTLDQARISADVFRKEALSFVQNFADLTEPGLEALVREKTPLTPPQTRQILSLLERPDVPNLLELIEADLRTRESRGFGEFKIHRALLPEQLDDLVKRIPSLADNQAFIYTRLRKLAPGRDADAEFDPKEREAWLDRAWAYVSRLAPAYNSLKANILYQRLQFDRSRGIYDETRFLAYLQLPRYASYFNPRYFDAPERARFSANLRANFTEAMPTALPIGDDESLVRAYFLHLFSRLDARAAARDPAEILKKWTPYIRDAWLKPVLAEALITNGIGQPERWASLLSPAAFQALKGRVDVEFSPANREFYAPGDDVSLDLFLKNTPKLIVRIYEINALSYFLANHRELNTDLPLDGLAANSEITHDFSAEKDGSNPFRRATRTFKFPELKGRRGAWIIEFIGGGKSSRALIRKGQWSVVQHIGPAGDMITVFDEALRPVKDVALWIDGTRLTVDKKSGCIIVPFTQERSENAVVADAAGDFATLVTIQRHDEHYKLEARFHVTREQLLPGKEATLAIRAELLLDDARIPLELLQNAKLTITSTTLDGVATTSEVKIAKFDPAKDFTYTFSVPERLASLEFELRGEVNALRAPGDGERTRKLMASDRLDVNHIDRTETIGAAFLRKIGDRYVVEVLGRNGEPIANHPLAFGFSREEFLHPVSLSLRTDERGRVDLGEMKGIQSVGAQSAGAQSDAILGRGWDLSDGERNLPPAIHAKSGEPIVIPWSGQAPPDHVSLLEVRNGTFVGNFRAAVAGFPKGAWNPGQPRNDGLQPPARELSAFIIKGLPPGDYSFAVGPWNHSLVKGAWKEPIEIRITDGKPVGDWLVSPNRELEIPSDTLLNIQSVARDGGDLVIQLANADAFTRVHIAATHFIPNGNKNSIFDALSGFPQSALTTATPARLPNLFAAGRQIGDEYRYILERRYSKIFPGNMLPRPGLILDPWKVRSTDLRGQRMAATQSPASTRGGRPGAPPVRGAPPEVVVEQDMALAPASVDLSFLANPAPALFNLAPEKHGVVRINAKAFGDRQYVEIYAENLTDAASRTLALPEAPTAFKDLRLARNLNPQKRFTEKKEETVLAAGETLKLADTLNSALETYDSLASIHALFTTLSKNRNLAKFAWILDWPKLTSEEKRAKYSEFACHELNFFLKRKDPEFFVKVILPYLKNKKDKTFMDDYLLGNDLHGYLEPWAFERLNVAERCLLAQSIPGERPAIARHLRELWELLPPDPDRENMLFKTALSGRSLRAAGASEPDATKGGSGLADRGRAQKALPPEPISALSSPPLMSIAGVQSIPGLEAIPRAPGAMPAMPAMPAVSTAGESPARLPYIPEEEAQRQRSVVRRLFRSLGPTKEWAENNYYQLPIQTQNADLIPISAFWRDYAAWDGKSPFLSTHLAEASRSFSEMMLALAVLDLPFESPKHATKTEGREFTLTAGGPLVAFHKEIEPAAPSRQNRELLVSENFFQNDDRYRTAGNEKFENHITSEFLSGVIYGANVVVTNPSSSPQVTDLLLQIPEGAIPVSDSKITDSKRFRLAPYTTQAFEYYFYFPAPRPEPFAHYPASLTQEEQFAGAAKPTMFKVVRQLSQVDKTSWDYVSQSASEDEVFAFLNRENIARLDLTRIAWRARKSAEFFHKLIALLAKRHTYNDVLYSYSVFHNDAPTLREWLRHQDGFDAQCGPWLNSKLLSIDPIERRIYQHLEYAPLVNQRVHRLGPDRRIPNPVLRAQYLSLLNILAYKPTLDAMDQMSVTYYLFLQDRTEEALARFHAIPPAALPTRLQYDYFQCYAAFYEERLADARGIANQYADYPVDRWRKLFAEVSSQLDEIEGKEAPLQKNAAAKGAPPIGIPSPPDREARQSNLANSEPSFDFKVENKQIALTWKNLSEVTIHYYLMDPEFLFSASPFVTQDSARVSIIKPTKTSIEKLPEGKDTLQIPLPGEFEKANVLVEIVAAGQRKSQTYHANTLKLAIAENYGRLEVRDQTAGKPVPKAYVKVYARLRDGTIRFFKDGYTDLRGRFDYASLNSSDTPSAPQYFPSSGAADGANFQMLQPRELQSVEKLSILILSDAHGALVREVSPPAE